MPTARELLEQADALMRRNRANALDDIPVLTEAMPAVAFTHTPRTPPPVDPGPPSVPLLTDNVDVIDEDATIGAEAVEGEPSVWLEFADESPSVIGDAPDSIAIVPPVELRGAPPDEALLASAEHEEIEFTLPAEEMPAEHVADDIAGLDATDAIEDEADGVLEDGAGDVLENVAEDVLAPDAAGTFEAATAAAIEADADRVVGADFDTVDDADIGGAEIAGFEAADEVGLDPADVADVADAADAGQAVEEAYAAVPVEAPPTAVTTAPVEPDWVVPTAAPPSPVLPSPAVVPAGLVALAASAPAVAAAASAAAPEPPAAAPAALSMADDDERWAAAAEEIRMQVLQRIDLFTDTGLRDQLTQRLQPIADRASADFVKAINLHVGDLLRTYVAEAIEREIERWRRDH